MSALTLTPGTLTDIKYPASAQDLLVRFANALYAPTATRTLYSGASMTGSQDGTTLWFDTTNKTLDVYDNGAWRTSLEGNTKTAMSTTPTTLTNVQVSNIGSQMAFPTGAASNLVAVTLNVRSTASKVLVTASIPVATSSLANDNLVAMLSKSGVTSAIAASYQRVPLADALVSLQIHYLDTPGTTGNITYGVRLGSTTSAATLGVLRTAGAGNTTIYGFLAITAQELSEP
jgi:hypothetical protein